MFSNQSCDILNCGVRAIAIDDLDLLIYDFESFGKNFPKSQKLSPDAFVQIAMQLAFYK